MILPSKHISQNRALLSVGARILPLLPQPKTASALWEEILSLAPSGPDFTAMNYDEFVLALDLLFLISAIEYQSGLLRRRNI
ncbi:MAG: ABC-three component system middle component 6 [Terracidiphilus sp.]